MATGQLWRTLAGHANDVTSVAFSPDGKTLVSGGNDQTVCQWSGSNTMATTSNG